MAEAAQLHLCFPRLPQARRFVHCCPSSPHPHPRHPTATTERAPADEPSPKSVVGFDFEEEVRVDDELRRDHVAWQEFGTTD